jgi:hypothetical protein
VVKAGLAAIDADISEIEADTTLSEYRRAKALSALDAERERLLDRMTSAEVETKVIGREHLGLIPCMSRAFEYPRRNLSLRPPGYELAGSTRANSPDLGDALCRPAAGAGGTRYARGASREAGGSRPTARQPGLEKSATRL